MTEEKHKGERIAKVIARAGICSRRDAEERITQGRVRVNNKLISSAALNVTDQDIISVDGKIIAQSEQTRLFLYHKPAGLVTSHKDEHDRETVFSQLPPDMPRVVSIGRLDLNTEGLLLLTNDGELARYLELPATGWSRKYRVRVHGRVEEKKLDRLRAGITVSDVKYQPITVTIDETNDQAAGTNTWLSVILREGKNREIRRVMEAIGLKVTRLIRTDYGPFSLGKMPRGSVAEIKASILQAQISTYFKERNITLEDRPLARSARPQKPQRRQEIENPAFSKSKGKDNRNKDRKTKPSESSQGEKGKKTSAFSRSPNRPKQNNKPQGRTPPHKGKRP